MKIIKSIDVYYNLNKLAVPIDEMEKWMNPEIAEQVRSVPEIIKDPRLVQFREKIHIENFGVNLTSEETLFKNDYVAKLKQMSGITTMILNLIKEAEPDKIGIPEKTINDLKLKQIIINIINEKEKSPRFDLCFITGNFILNEKPLSIKLLYSETKQLLEQSIAKWIAFFKGSPSENKLSDLLGLNAIIKEIPRFDKLTNANAWNNRMSLEERQKSATSVVVFTTHYKDILGMSARSTWDSCQNIAATYRGSVFVKQILGSCVAKGIGIIYITDETAYKGRGERMYYRCAVWIVKNTENNKDVLLLQKMYPGFDKDIADQFKTLLEKYCDMDVVIGELADPNTLSKLVRIIGEEEEPYPKAYMDVQIKALSNYNSIIEKIKDYIRTVPIVFEFDTKTDQQNIEKIKNAIRETMIVLFDEVKNNQDVKGRIDHYSNILSFMEVRPMLVVNELFNSDYFPKFIRLLEPKIRSFFKSGFDAMEFCENLGDRKFIKFD